MAINKKDTRKGNNQAPSAPSVKVKAIKKQRVSAQRTIAEEPKQEPTQQPSVGFPIVGVGASAGGLAAFEAFFSGMPIEVDTNMIYVLVQHLAPDHKSILSELIQRYTRMQVFEVEDGMTVQPNCVYIIPPGRDMAFLHGRLQLLEPLAARGQRMPIDFFFRSLAQDQHEQAICIILSGTGSDGTLGLRSIKGEGGMVMVQTPESAEYDGMPRSAIGTGLVDYELAPVEMPAQLLAYVSQALGRFLLTAVPADSQTENALKKIFILLRTETGHDFSKYKLKTMNRRIARRMAVHQIESVELYVKFLQQTAAEVDSLFRDLLIGVTSFFRDPEDFKALEERVISKIFADKPADAMIRVWSPGCSTGEEAYSLAILMQEHLDILRKNHKVQIFATDIDSQAIAIARAGLYPASIAADVSPERLARFFTPEADGSAYRIHKGIREMLIFSEQDVIRDPPFSKLDLISCRNLLIYMGGDLQKKLIPMFHYALNPAGFLFLGTSESIGEFSDLFATLDRTLKIYQRKGNYHGVRRTPLGQLLPSLVQTDVLQTRQPDKTAVVGKLSLRELTEQALLQQVSPTGALVNGNGDILYLHGRTGMYLEPPPGVSGVSNILKMARAGLQHGLITTLHKAATTKNIARSRDLRVKTNGDFSLINLTIRPVITGPGATGDTPLYLVILEETAPVEPGSGDHETPPDGAAGTGPIAHIDSLRQELQAREEYLQAANEELETANEELQSANEELQSTNEELETSKEEMQSINEEFSTVNAELQTKVTDLSRANNDMNNLLAGTGIATVFVDHQLRILRFTAAAAGIINLIISDIGRPVGHIVSNLVGYNDLIADTQDVLETLVPKEIEAQTREGSWYKLRILPYRTLDNVIEGVVITFIDITEIKKIQDALREANELFRLSIVMRDARDAIIVQDLHGSILAWNPGAERMYGWSEVEALTMNVRDLIPEGLRDEALAKVYQLSLAEILKPYRTQRIARDGMIMEVSIVSTALMNKDSQMYAISTTERLKGQKIGRKKKVLHLLPTAK